MWGILSSFATKTVSYFANPEVVKIFKQIILIGFLITSLTLFSSSFLFPSVLPFLTVFFKLVRSFVMPFDFMIDTDTLVLLVGFALSVQVGLWSIRAYLSFIKFFQERKY